MGYGALGREYLDACDKIASTLKGGLKLFIWLDGHPEFGPHKGADLALLAEHRDAVWVRIPVVKEQLVAMYGLDMECEWTAQVQAP